jgi:MFS transporter, FSR family, fosmidomycin resistance protein
VQPIGTSATGRDASQSHRQDETRRPDRDDGIRPRLSLGLLSVQHALIHGQSALYPLVYLAVIDEFRVTAATIVILSTIGSMASGLLQYSFGALTRFVARPTLLGGGGLLVGAGTAAQAAAAGFGPFAVANVASRIGGSPQHPVGNALLADQFPARRIGTAIAVHVAGGNVGTVAVGFVAALAIATMGWRGSVTALGVAAAVVAVLILLLVREARPVPGELEAHGPVRRLYRAVLADRDLRWLYAAAVLGGGSRGLGVLNIFVPLYLHQVIGLDPATIGLMYGVLLAASVPGPLVAGWLSDRVGRKPIIVGAYLAGAASLAFFVLAGDNPLLLWIGLAALSLTSFVESPQLQALLADVTPRPLRDAAFSTYFALAFGVGSMWGLVYGAVINAGGEGSGLGTVFWLMAGASVAAAIATLRIRIPADLPGHRPRGPASA